MPAKELFNGRTFQRLVHKCAFLALLLILPACYWKQSDSNRQPGPPEEPLPTNAMEGSANGRGVSPATGPKMTYDAPPITDISRIASDSDPAALLTRQVNLSSVKVQRVLNSQYVIVGPDGSRGVVVRLKELMPNLKPGQSLHVSGMIAQLGEDLAHWELNPEEKKQISDRPIFINAVISEVATNQ
jgi:hypothetical protein